MKRIDTSTAQADKFGPGKNGFRDGDPLAGILATRLAAAWFDAVQEEIARVVEGAGAALDPGSHTQLLEAIQTLVQAASAATGDVKLSLAAVAPAGWVMMNDGSIGNAASAATTRANADCQALFALIWSNVSNTWCPTQDSAGAPVARGASAAADWAANRRLVLPRTLGRALGVQGAGSGLSVRALGERLGAETHTMTLAEMVIHDHGIPTRHTSSALGNDEIAQANATGTLLNSKVTNSRGGSTPFSIMPPITFLNAFIKL